MVETRKGLSYSIEVIVASLVILAFALGTFQVEDGTNWSEYRGQVAANDLTHTLQATGHIESTIQNRGTGTLETTVSTLSDRDAEISGTIEGIPINQINVGFHTLEEDRYHHDVIEVDQNDQCHGELSEIEEDMQDPDGTIYRSDPDDNLAFEDQYNAELYFADTGSLFEEVDIDSVWVNNGTNCQFADESGPFRLHEIFRWADDQDGAEEDYFDFKDFETGSNPQFTVHHATEVVEIRNILDREVNGIETDTNVDTFTFNELGDLTDYDTIVFRDTEAFNQNPDINNYEPEIREFLEQGSIIFMMTFEDQSEFEGNLPHSLGFEWAERGGDELDYENYEEISSATFTDSEKSRNVETYFTGLGGQSPIIQSPGKIMSNTQGTFSTENPVVEMNNVVYNEENWDRQQDNLAGPSSNEDTCNYWEGQIDFPTGTYSVRNAELQAATGCGAWAAQIQEDGQFESYLTAENLILDRMRYIAFPRCEVGSDEEDCVQFVYSGNPNVEGVAYRSEFEDLEGEEVYLTGYPDDPTTSTKELTASLVYASNEGELSFQGDEEPADIDTETYGMISERTNMPYRLNLRWSR